MRFIGGACHCVAHPYFNSRKGMGVMWRTGFIVGVLWLGLLVAPISAQDVSDQVEAETYWWNDRVFYEIFVRSFADSDGDGIGDLQGVISKLDYLNDGDPTTTDDLGVTGIWLMPIMESPSYHGYDVTDYLRVEPDYGTNEDFKALIAAAHERGIAVIIDLVLNHTSREHPWFRDAQTRGSQHDSWYRWSLTKPSQRGPWGQPEIWYPANGRYYYAVFWDGMPDLNLKNPAVTQAMYNVAGYWLEEMGVDGFRMDAVRYYTEDGDVLASADSTFTWLKFWNAYIDSINPDAFTVGEIWTNTIEVSKYVQNGVDSAFEFDLARAMLDAAKNGSNLGIGPIQGRAERLLPEGQYSTFLTNHDQNRVMNEMGQNSDKAKVAASLLLTAPGVPFLYYGEEIGMIGVKPDECIRTPMQWDGTEGESAFMAGKRCETNGATHNVAAQLDDPESLLSHYRNLIRLRHEQAALRVGDFHLVGSEADTVYSYLRTRGDERVLVIINLGGQPIQDYALKLDSGNLSNPVQAELLFGEGSVSSPMIDIAGGFDGYLPVAELAPYSTYVIALEG